MSTHQTGQALVKRTARPLVGGNDLPSRRTTRGCPLKALREVERDSYDFIRSPSEVLSVDDMKGPIVGKWSGLGVNRGLVRKAHRLCVNSAHCTRNRSRMSTWFFISRFHLKLTK